MKKTITTTITFIVAIFALMNQTATALVTNMTGGMVYPQQNTNTSSVSGGGSNFIPPTEVQQYLDLGGIQVSLYGRTESAQYRHYYDGEGNLHQWYQEAYASGNINVNITQGFLGMTFNPIENSTSISRMNEEGDYRIQWNLSVLMNAGSSWSDYQSSQSVNFFGINYEINSSTEHQRIWSSYKDQPITTDNITAGMWVNFENSELVDSKISMNNNLLYWTDDQNYYKGFIISSSFIMHYLGDLSWFNSFIPLAEIAEVPEPATLALFGLGGLLIRRRRK